MKKIFFCLLIIFSLSCLFAQAPIDIFDPFYDDLALWQNVGLINDSPDARPYPLQEIKRILNIVIEKGSPNQIRRAKEYYSRFFESSLHYGGMTTFDVKVPSKKYAFSLSPVLETNLKLHDILTASAHVNFSLLTALPEEEPLPAFQLSNKDIASDQGNIGSFKILPMFNSGVTIGTPEYYLSAGIARTAFGPFADENIIIGEQAFHAGQFIFVVNKEKFTYNQVLLCLTASNDKGQVGDPGKFLAGHSITYRPLPWISVGLFDFITYGGRFEPTYLLPLSAFFIGQSIYRFPDNSILGLTFGIKPLKGMKLDMVLLADDLGFNEIVKFQSAKWRIAGKFGIAYTMPQDHWFTTADLSYTMVTPYCYTHYDGYNINKANHQNYSHYGAPLGSNLAPNSDRIKLKLKFRPLYGFDINFSNTFIRHANINENLDDTVILKKYFTDKYNTDGSVFNHATVKGYQHAYLYSTPFLTQDTIQYINQLGLDMVLHFPILKSGGNMQFKLGYVFEANINSGINKNIYTPTSKSIANAADIIAERDRQRKEWLKTARGKEFNHFLNIAVKVVY